MNITAVLPTVILVTDSKEFYTQFSFEIKKQLPDIIIMWVSAADARKAFPAFSEDNYQSEGFDHWVPRESCNNVSRRWRRSISHLIR